MSDRKVNVTNVKATDPELSFDLEIPNDQPLLTGSLRVVITVNKPTPIIEGPYITEVIIHNATNERFMSFLVPFGDKTNYKKGEKMSVKIELYSPLDSLALLESPYENNDLIGNFNHHSSESEACDSNI